MNFKRILSVVLCVALLLPCMVLPGFAESEPVVYLDSVNGSDSNDGLTEATAVATLNGAYAALGGIIGDAAKGTIILVNDYTFTFSSSTGAKRDITSAGQHSYEVVFTGKTPQTALEFYIHSQCYIGMKGPTTFENITVRIAEDSANSYLSIHGRGKLTIGEGVTTSPNSDQRPTLSAGAYYNSSAVMDLTVNSGDWRNAYAGGYVSTMTGTGNLTINGGYVAKAGTNYNGTQNGDSNITVNGGTVGNIIGSSINSSGKQTGNVYINLNGGTVEGEIDADGVGTLSGTATINAVANNLTLLTPGTVAINDYTGGTLTLGSATKVSIIGTVTGTTAVTVNPSVRYNFDYITAPADTADNAFTFSQANMTVEAGSTKVWKNLDADAGFTGLVLKAPSAQTVKLYTGTQNGSLVIPDSTKTVDGIRYDYYTSIMGTYRYVSSRSGYYTVTKVIYMTEAESLTETVVDATTGKKAGTGFEPTNVKEYSDEMLVQRDSTETAAWWDDYAQYLTTPAFAEGRADHQATTQDEMEAYLAGLDGSTDNMYIYSMGKSTKYGFDMPIVIFTKTDLSGADTLEEAAALVNANNKVTVHYQAQIHGNEPAAGEAALALIGRLDTSYGDELLNTLNIYVIPRLNPDGSYLFTRNDSNNLNMNRDMLLAQANEIQYHHYVYSLFNPELAIDSHEYTYEPELSSGPFNDMMIASGHNGNSGEAFVEYSEMFARLSFQPLYDYEMQPSYYTNVTNGKYAASGTNYRGMRGSVSLLLESRGIGGGNNTYERRVTAHLISMEQILGYAAENSAELQAVSDAERQRIATSGMTYEDTDMIVLEHEQTTDTTLKYQNTTYNLASGTGTSTYSTTPKAYSAALPGRARVRPTAYVIPAGESWTQDVLELMDIQDISYYFVPAGISISLQQYTGTIEAAALTNEQYYTFENGCYVLPMNQNNANILAILMEPDIADEYNVDAGGSTATVPSGTLAQMGIIPAFGEAFPIYRYVQDLNSDGTIDTLTASAAPTGLTAVAPAYVGATGGITGLDSSKLYEYRSSKDADYTVIASGTSTISGLEAGTYYVRYQAQDGIPSQNAVIVISYDAVAEYAVYLDSTNGSDSNNGYLKTQPVATLETAYSQLTAIMAYAPENTTGKIVITGTYNLGTARYAFPAHDYPVLLTGSTASSGFTYKGGSSSENRQIGFSGDTYLDNLTITLTNTNQYNYFCANGHKLTIGKNVTTATSKYYFNISGGAYGSTVASADLTILSGTWNQVYAGGYCGKTNGDIRLVIDGATITGQLQNTYNATTTGNLNITVSNTTFTSNVIYCGNTNKNHVDGNVTLTLGENVSVSAIYAGSRDTGNVTGTVTIIIDGADLTDTQIIGKAKNTTGTVGKTVLILKDGSLGTVPTDIDQVTVDTSAGGTVSYPASVGVDQVIGNGVGKVGTTAYAPLQYAADQSGSYVQLMIDCTAVLKLNGDLYLDLAGFDLGGSIDLNGFKLYGLDSTTDRYSDAGIGYLTATLKNGAPEVHFKDDGTHLGSILRYVAVPSSQGYTFHRLYLGITHKTLKPSTNGVGYKAVFAADDTLKAYMDSFGYTLQLDGFSAQTKTMDSGKLVSLDTVTLRIDNFDIQNYGETNLYAGVCVVLSDGTVIETAPLGMTVKELVEAVNADTGAFSDQQLAALKAMLQSFSIPEDWEVSNII